MPGETRTVGAQLLPLADGDTVAVGVAEALDDALDEALADGLADDPPPPMIGGSGKGSGPPPPDALGDAEALGLIVAVAVALGLAVLDAVAVAEPLGHGPAAPAVPLMRTSPAPRTAVAEPAASRTRRPGRIVMPP